MSTILKNIVLYSLPAVLVTLSAVLGLIFYKNIQLVQEDHQVLTQVVQFINQSVAQSSQSNQKK